MRLEISTSFTNRFAHGVAGPGTYITTTESVRVVESFMLSPASTIAALPSFTETFCAGLF